MSAAVGIVTETWLADVESLQRDLDDLLDGAGVGLICRNRATNSSGVAHGGVAVAYRAGLCSIKRIEIENPDNYEVLVTVASLPGYSRKLVIIACYLPPGYPVARGRGALVYVEDVVLEVKRRYRDPFLIVAGDFNQWEIGGAMSEFPDLREADVGPTRKDRVLDRIFTNFGRSQTEAGTVPPLEVEPGHPGAASDHRVAFVRAELPRLCSFEWITHQYRYYNEESVVKFGQWLAGFDQKAKYYQATVTGALDAFFLLIKVRRKSSDCPWINNKIRSLIIKRKRVCTKEGRSEKWRRLRRITDNLILKRKESYLQSQRQVLLVDDARRNFFRNIKAFKSQAGPFRHPEPLPRQERLGGGGGTG